MPRPSLSRPPPLSAHSWETNSDVENEPPNTYNVHRYGPTNRKLFFTPTQKNPSSPSPTFLLTRDSITRRYYKQHENDKTPIKTPLPRRPSHAPSTSRRPKITRLDATPSVNRTLQGSAPERWRMRQVTDLTAWLNHELSATSDAATLPMHQVASSVVFLNQFAAVNAIYRSKNVHKVLSRITNEICSGRLNVSKSIKLASFLKEREELISLLLLNYHPHWLLLALSVVLGINLARDLDEAVEKAGADGRSFNYEQVLMQALENAIRNDFLADAPSDNVTSREQVSPAGQHRDRYNALILRRTLVVIYLQDVAKRQCDPIIKPDPPLFRTTSQMTSSVDVLRSLQKLLLNDHGDIVKFLAQRGYSVSYKSPVYEPFGSLRIVNLSTDMQDGSRLCKLASIMRQNHQILTQVIRIGPGHRPTTALAIKKQNITLALNSMKECLPHSLQSRFQWHGTPHDIATGNTDKTVAVLWQIAALWMEYVIVHNQKLKEELEVVKNAFRVARRNPDSPSNNVHIDLTSLADSPSKLQIIESCDTDSGDLLLMWCATLCGIYGVEIRDFTEDFRDGAVLCLILHHYCPELMQIDEINRIPAGEHRGAFAAEAEHKHVQKNLDLFMDRCRLLGTIPEISLSSEATLAPAFHDSLKQESVGRVMQLLASYLFRRMMMQKDISNAKREVWEIMNNHNGTPEMRALQEINPEYERETVLVGKVTDDAMQNAILQQSEEGSSRSFLDSQSPATSERRGNASAPAEIDPNRNDFPDGKKGDLAHVYTRMRHVQSRRATRPRPSQLSTDREHAAQVILSHYRGYKARQAYNRIRSGIVEVQSSFRGYFARQEVDQIRKNQKEAAQTSIIGDRQEEPSPPVMGNCEPPKELVDESFVTPEEDKRSLPVRIGQQILEFLPIFRRHLLTVDSYSKRMLAHERTQKEHQAATIIQSAVRSHLAQRTRNRVETERNKTRQTWISCAAETAKTALRIAESHRRELAKWHEQLLTNALDAAGNRFNSEMSRVAAARTQAALERKKEAEVRSAQEAKFAAELHRQKIEFEEQMTIIERRAKALEACVADVEHIPVSSADVRKQDEIFEILAQSIKSSDAREDAVRLVLTDLNTQRERADRFEIDLRNARDREQEAKDEILQLNGKWEQRFEDLATDIQQWYGTVLTGAICTATANYRVHMNELSTKHFKEEQERLTWEEELRKGISAFDGQEQAERDLLTDVLAKLDSDTDNLNEVISARELWEDKTQKQEARFEQYELAIGAELDALDEQSKQKDIAWATTISEFDVEVEDTLCLIDNCEKTQEEHDRHNIVLDEEIQSFITAEHRKDMERKFVEILGHAEERFYEEMSERREENENNLYCRHEIDIQLDQEDQEEALHSEEIEEGMEKIERNIDNVEDNRCELEEHASLVDSYIKDLFSLSPSVLEFHDVPDTCGKEIEDDVDECSNLYSRTCQLVEQICSDRSEEKIEADRKARSYDKIILESSPESVQTASVKISFEGEVSSEDTKHDSDECDDLQSIHRSTSLSTTSGLYQRLVEEELEYYNGKGTHDIGIQTGSGPNSISSSPVRDIPAEIETQCTFDAEVQPSETEQSCSSHISESSSADKRKSSLLSSRERDYADEPSSPNVNSGQQECLSFSHDSINASPSETYVPIPTQHSLSERTLCVEDESRVVSPGPLDTLAQLALQDALNANMIENGFDSGYNVQAPESRLLPSGEGFTPPTEIDGKENIIEESAISDAKSGESRVYGLRLDSLLRTWNSPMSAQGTNTGKGGDLIDQKTTAQLASSSPSMYEAVEQSNEKLINLASEAENAIRGNKPENLGDLSAELKSFNIQPHRQSVESVVQSPASATKLESVMRRISIAASSPQVKSRKRTVAVQDRQGPHRDIIRIIFTLIRYCSRSEEQLKLRELGISIICDFCVVHRRVVDIMGVEECIDVLTTCLQYHRDQETIFEPTVRILWEIAIRPEGKQMIIDSENSVARLQSVNELLVSHVAREQKNRDRIRQANMIVEIVRKRRAEGGSLKSMTEALRIARDESLNSEVLLNDSHRLLGDLVAIVS